MNCLLQADGLSLTIGRTRVCEGLQLCIAAGQSWALLGRNGVGKTTLLHHLAGLRRNAGRVRLDGRAIDAFEPRARARRVAVLLQHSSRGFGASVLESVLSGRHPHLGAFAWEGADDLDIAKRCIAAAGLEVLSGRSLDTLSGGELRRVEIARLLTQQAAIALLDEPLNHLDLAHQAAMLKVLGERCVGENRAMLMVVHDLNVAWSACDHWLLLDGNGKWHAGPREALADPQLLGAAFDHPIDQTDTPSGPLFQARL